MAEITSINSQTEINRGSFGSGPGAFDPRYYLAKNPDVARQLSSLQGYDKETAALRHFIDYGAKEGRNPSALFDIKAYLAANPDVAASGVNPLLHFRNYGKAEGRASFPVQDGARQSRAVEVPQTDGAPAGLAGIGQSMMGFQLDAAPAEEGGPAGGVAGDPASMSGSEIWAHGSALMQTETGVGSSAPAVAPPQPNGEGVMLLAGLGAFLPGMPAVQDVQLLKST